MAAIACVLFVTGGHVAAQGGWESETIYQIITDRFFNGDSSNDNAAGNHNPASSQGVHGGDFKGIEQKLEYIKALGATAIWISPVVENGDGDYHGYAARDFYKTAPQMGTMAELKQLVNAAHGKGLRVVNDVVVNHGAYDFVRSDDAGYPNFKAPPGYNLRYRDSSKQYAPPFHPGSGQPLTALFHNNGFIQDFNDAAQVELGSLQGLDDFRTESSYVREQMANIYKFWIDEVGFDAFRIDTVKHVEHGFWQTWCPAIRQHATETGKPDFFMFGEVLDRSEAKVGSYTGTRAGGPAEMDSVLDYPLYFAIQSVFAAGTGNTKQLDDHFAALDANYDPSAKNRLVTFLDNHDQPRFLTVAPNRWSQSRLDLALTLLHTAPGMPCIYYGTEQGFNGGNDPNNREDMFAGQFEPGYGSQGDNFNMGHSLFQRVAGLNNLRRIYPALRTGTFASLWNSPGGPGLYAYARRLGAQEVIVVLNTAEVAQTMPPRPTIYPPGTVLGSVYDPTDMIVVSGDGQLPTMQVPALGSKIYVERSQYITLDPLVSFVTPAHDTKNVAGNAKITMGFSQPMNTASVQAAFSTSPATQGQFTWSQGDRFLTYQVTGGLPAATTVTVQLNNTAADSIGKRLRGAFESHFTTAAGGATDVTPPTITISSPAEGAIVDWNRPVRGFATDDTAIDRVEQRLDDGPWISVMPDHMWNPPGQSYDWTAILPFSYLVNGPHTISMRAIDTFGNISEVASVGVRFFTRPGPYDRRVFAWDSTNGGTSGCEPQYHFWESAPPYNEGQAFKNPGRLGAGFIGGNHAKSSNSISNVCYNEWEIYQHERYSSPREPFRYLFRVPPGVYEVTLHEAETYMNGPNQRRFDVYLQGERKFADIDIFAAAGGKNRAVTFTSQTTVANGLLDVQFTPVYDNARSSGIHVRKIGEVVTDPDGIPDWWRLGVFGHATGLEADQSRAGDDPDGDGQTNREEFIAGTNPSDRASVFRMLGTERNGSDIAVRWLSADGTYYRLQRRDALDAGSWTNVGEPHRGFGGPTGAWDYGGATRGRQQFYRVLVVPPPQQ